MTDTGFGMGVRQEVCGRKSPSGVQGQSPDRRSGRQVPPEADDLQIVLQMYSEIKQNQKCGPMPNVMAALPNIGGALCSTPQSLADAHY